MTDAAPPNQFTAAAAPPPVLAPADPLADPAPPPPALASVAQGTPEAFQVLLEAKMKETFDSILSEYRERFEAMAQDAELQLSHLKENLEDILAALTKSDVKAEFLSSVDSAKKEIAAIVAELSKGGIVERLHSLELAVASHAAPLLSQSVHDGHGLLQAWFDSIKGHFLSSAEAAKAPPPPAA